MSRCKACNKYLVFVVHDDDDNEITLPDDLELRCGCHFHWECLMEAAQSVALSLACPGCESYLAVNSAGPSSADAGLQTPSSVSILARYSNEGGVEEHQDILPSITEEAYVQNNPQHFAARALHAMCTEGDAEGIVELLRNVHDRVSDMGAVICYQDPLAEMKSGLHLAVEGGQHDVAWLLLWLSSTVSTEAFPPSSRQAAESMGLGRLSVQSDGDIRGLRDGRGRTAESIARQKPELWSALLDAGALSA